MFRRFTLDGAVSFIRELKELKSDRAREIMIIPESAYEDEEDRCTYLYEEIIQYKYDQICLVKFYEDHTNRCHCSELPDDLKHEKTWWM